MIIVVKGIFSLQMGMWFNDEDGGMLGNQPRFTASGGMHKQLGPVVPVKFVYVYNMWG